jgi:hypothetical protein
MADIESRVQHAIAELTGNESLLGMLEADAASELLDWGIKMSTSIVEETGTLDDLAAEQMLQPRLKAIRSSMRSIGNWAAGKYVEPEDRVQVRDKLLEQFKVIFGGEAPLPSADSVDGLLDEADDTSNTQHQLVVKMMRLIPNQNQGDL